jgi:hypothetical protein
MISIKNFTARLGNQLFQLANAISYSKRSNEQFSMPSWVYSEIFKGDFAPKPDTNQQKLLWVEPGFNYTPIPVGATFLEGYYQSEKYFIDNSDEILEMFSFKNSVVNKIKKLHSDILNDERPKVSMHLRRGDYLKFPNHHPVLDVSYFVNAAKQFPDNSLFVVFSDDPDWCKSNFPVGNYIFVEGQKDYEDLCLMSMCDHNCIANSTFSWWGAWLNKNPEKIVVAPKKWFGPAYAHFSTKDLYCPGWIKV